MRLQIASNNYLLLFNWELDSCWEIVCLDFISTDTWKSPRLWTSTDLFDLFNIRNILQYYPNMKCIYFAGKYRSDWNNIIWRYSFWDYNLLEKVSETKLHSRSLALFFYGLLLKTLYSLIFCKKCKKLLKLNKKWKVNLKMTWADKTI